MDILSEPIFWIGVVFGLFFSVIFSVLEQNRKFSMNLRMANDGRIRVDNMLNTVRSGHGIDLETYYPQPKNGKGQKPVGYLAWRDLSFWLASIYADHKYLDSPVDEFWNLSKMIFGDNCAYIKLEALNETINRSTAYLLPNSNNGRTKDDCRKKLFEMVWMIIESYDADVYERSRVDNRK